MADVVHSKVLRFGAFELDLGRRELREGGARVPLQRKPFQLLQYLAQHSERVISKDELLDQVWGRIVTESALTSALRDLRKALRDEGRSPQVIENVRGQGYRFIADVQELPASTRDEGARRSERNGWRWKVAIAGAVAAMLAVGLWLLRSSAESIRSIAVLPLENLSGDPAQDHIVAGMHEQLIHSVARIGPELLVISRTSVVQLDREGKTILELAAELGVDAILEGGAMREGDEVLVTVRLIDARTDRYLWAESYQRPFSGMIGLSREISSVVADRIRIALSPERQGLLATSDRVDPDALDLYLRGIQELQSGEGRDTQGRRRQHAAELLQAAIHADPAFADAYVALAASYRQRMAFSEVSADEGQPPLRSALERALALDENLALARALLALSNWERDHDWSKAEHELSRALEIAPSERFAMTAFAAFLAAAARHDEALALAERAVSVDPLNVITHRELLARLFTSRQFERAIEQAGRMLAAHPENNTALAVSGFAYAALGEDQAAYRRFARLGRSLGWDLDALERAYEQGGLTAAASRMVAEFRKVGAQDFFVGGFACLAERPEEAMDVLARLSLQHPLIMQVATWPPYDCVHSDPRFLELLRKINWPGLETHG